MMQALSPLKLTAPISTFLARHGLSDASLTALPSDASPRSYIRLNDVDQLLMEDRTDPVSFAAFIRLARHLGNLELSAPRVYGADPSAGLALIEDFGKNTYGALLEAGHDEVALYALAVDALAHLHYHPKATAVTVPVYGTPLLLEEVSVFSEWFVPAFRPDLDVAVFDATFHDLWAQALAPVDAAPMTLVLRDFHIDNLMLLEGRSGVAACGLLDFQDAALGAPEYDLMSLLQDARRDLAPGLEQAMLKRYLAAVSHACGTTDQIMQRYYVLAAQRHTRLVGQFPRLNLRDGKSGYLRFMPRVIQQMQVALADAKLHEIAEFLDTTLPGWRDAGPAMSHTS